MSEVEEILHDYLVVEGWAPERFAETMADGSDLTVEGVMSLIRDKYTLTDDPGRRSMDYCLDCNPHLNGKHGRDGTEAIAKYKVPDIKGEDQFITGWQGLCEQCARSLKAGGYDVVPLSGHEDHEMFQDTEDTPEHECEDPSWTKTSLVTEDGGFDWVECDDCGIQAKRHGLGEIEVVGHER